MVGSQAGLQEREETSNQRPMMTADTRTAQATPAKDSNQPPVPTITRQARHLGPLQEVQPTSSGLSTPEPRILHLDPLALHFVGLERSAKGSH